MVKTPSTRHSKSGREPVTIEHAPSKAARSGTGKGDAAASTPRRMRHPATRVGETHDIGEEFMPTPAALEKEALVDTHADSPIMHPELAPAKSSSEMLNADRPSVDKPEAPLDQQPGNSLPQDDTRPAATHNPYDEPDPEPARPSRAAEQPVRQPVTQTNSSSGGTGRLLGAAVVGGVIALCGYGLLNALGLFGDRSATELAALQAEIADLRSGLQTDGGQDLSQQIAQMRSDLAAAKEGGGSAQELAAISQRVAELGSQIEAAGQNGGQGGDLGPVSGRIDTLEQRLSGLQQEIGALGQRVESGASDPRLAVAVTASALKAAIDRGDGFQAELDAYAGSAGGERPEITALRDLAGSGVPTRAAITQELPGAASAMVAAAKPEPQNSGVIARLWSSASDLVEVRPVGADAQGNEPGAVVARLEAAVEAGDYGRALSEYELLPQASKSAGEAFMAKVRARQTADELVGKALADALKS